MFQFCKHLQYNLLIEEELIEEMVNEVLLRRFVLDVSISDVFKIDAVNVKTVVLSTSFHWIIQVMSLQEC